MQLPPMGGGVSFPGDMAGDELVRSFWEQRGIQWIVGCGPPDDEIGQGDGDLDILGWVQMGLPPEGTDAQY